MGNDLAKATLLRRGMCIPSSLLPESEKDSTWSHPNRHDKNNPRDGSTDHKSVINGHR